MIPRVLIVSPHFPPVNAPDMQRIRMSLPAFVAAGWEVTVLTVSDPTPTAPVEPELVSTVPAAVTVERAFCLSRRWTARFGVNNVALRSLPFIFLAGCQLLTRRRYDVVYFSTTMFIVLPLGRLWRMFCGVPYVIDLQDPWVTDFYSRPGAPRPPGGWKYRVARGLGVLLEGWTMAGAARLVSVSAAYVGELRERHPAVRRIPALELPFGSPDLDLAHVRAGGVNRPRLLPAGEGLQLVFAGALGPGMLGPVEILFAAVEQVRAAGVAVAVYFFGTSYSAAGRGRPVTLALAARYGLEDCVHEQPDRLPYLDAIQLTLEAGAGLLLGSADLDFTPSKVLAVLAAGRPVLALAPAGSALIARLAQLGQPCITIPLPGPVEGSIRETAGRIRALAAGRVAPAAPENLAPFTADAVARRQLEILAAAAAAA